MTKKERELHLLTRLRELHREFPAGAITAYEEPDFLVHTASGPLGIEIQQWAYDDPMEFEQLEGPPGASLAKGGSPTLRHENVTWKTVLRAQALYKLTGSPDITVTVGFHPLFPRRPKNPIAFQRRDIERLAAEIAELARMHLPDLGRHIQIPPNQLPQGVDSVFLRRPSRTEDVLWAPSGGGVIPSIRPAHLEESIKRKEVRLPRYRESATAIWLLIVATGFNPSGFCEVDPAVQAHLFRTHFDAVFFLHYSRGLWPLHVKAPAT